MIADRRGTRRLALASHRAGQGATRNAAYRAWSKIIPIERLECPIDEALIDRLDELTRRIQEQAIAQAWSLDWTALASLRRQAADARAAKNQWVSLRKIARDHLVARPGRPLLSQERGTGFLRSSLIPLFVIGPPCLSF